MQIKINTSYKLYISRILLLFLLWICTKGANGQARINGPTCITAGSTYSYTLIGTSSGGTYSIVNGTNATTGGSAGGYTGFSFTLNITWNAGMTSGQVSFTSTGQSQPTTLPVSTAGPIVPGTISNTSQSINYNTVPATINCSFPSGGSCSGTYSFQWQQSTDNVNFTNISGATSQNLSFSSALTQTTYYRRNDAVSGGGSANTNKATVTVYPQLVGGVLAPGAYTCNYNSTPGTISLSSVAGGNGTYTYQWQSSPDNATWTNVSGATSNSYSVPTLTSSIYYRVAVTSNGVTVNSGISTITVLPQIAGGTVSPSSQAINYNTTPASLSVSGVSGGNGTYSYQWQSSPNNSTWTNVSGATNTTFAPGNLTATTYYHVVVTSNGASVNSSSITVNVYPQVVGGTITPASVNVNYNTAPGTLTLSGVSGGNGSYSYQWQSSSNSGFASPTNVGANSTSYTPPALTTSTYYRVLVTSNAAQTASGSSFVNVYPLIQPGSVSPGTQTVAYNSTPAALTASGASGGSGSYTYQWQSSSDNINWNNIFGATSATYSFSSGQTAPVTYYRVQVSSNGGTATTPYVVVNVNPQLNGGTVVPGSVKLTSGTGPGILSVAAVTGGSCGSSYAYQWQSSSDNNTWANVTGATGRTYNPGNLSATVYYRVMVTCGSETAYSQAALVAVGTVNTNLNYIRERDYKKPGVTDTTTALGLASPVDVQQVTQYFDGLGRPVQTVAKQASPLQNDMVSIQVYDALGREVSKYLPYTSATNDGNYKSNPTAELASFNTVQFPSDQFFYSQAAIEPSPLNRPLVAYAAGNSWVGGSRGVGVLYQSNTVFDSVRIWSIAAAAGSLPTTTGTYPTGALYKTITTDEAGHQVIEYKDLQEKLILRKTQLSNTPAAGASGWLNTYYVYDDLDNLRFLIPPRAVEWLLSNAWNWAATQGALTASELCTRYEYDARKNMIIKKMPGAVEQWMVYDARDRVVMTQDSLLRGQHKWLSIRYDIQNRQDSTALITDATNYNNLSYHLTQAVGSIYYPTLTGYSPELLTQSFYDNYNWLTGTGLPSGMTTNYTTNGSYFITSYNTSPAYAVAVTAHPIARGMVTGTMAKVLTTGSQYLYGVNYYDDRGRLIQLQRINYTSGVDTLTTQYDFTGKPLRSLMTHRKGGLNPQNHIILTKIAYDADSREKSVYKNIDNTGDQLIDSVQYDELGRMRTKYLGNAIDNLTYDYNIRGWVTDINKTYITNPGSHYFGMELAYDQASSAAGTAYAAQQFNGNIAGITWKGGGDGINRRYDFTYDNVNRLTGADFNQQVSGGFNKSANVDFSVSGITYDANGNVQSMKQRGLNINSSSTIDSLTYSYRYNGYSNKLQGVADGVNNPNSLLGDFHYNPNGKGGVDYNFDGDGNIISDFNKTITFITYNYLRLPQQIYFSGKGNVIYTYDATGAKLAKQTMDSLSMHATTTLYLGGFVYQQRDTIATPAGGVDTLQFVTHEEGRARWAFHRWTSGAMQYKWEYDFYEKDHLGNIREVLTQQRDTAVYKATMEAAYRVTENALFYNIPQTCLARSSVPGTYPYDPNATVPNDSVCYVNGSTPKQGPAIILKVMAGDKFDVSVNALYRSGSGSGNTDATQEILASLANGIFSLSGGAKGSLSTLNNTTTSPLLAAIGSFRAQNTPVPSGKPMAYLNFIVLDDQFNYDNINSGAIPVGLPDALLPPLARSGVNIPKNGFLYIYVSNETKSLNVYFDNLTVVHYAGPLLEESHYYPFGLTMAGISDKALKANYAANKFRFNGGNELQSNEFSDGSGLDMYDAVHRMYDPQLGRFEQLDELGEVTHSWSPYAFSVDNPANSNDPMGLDSLTRRTNLAPAYVTAKYTTQSMVNKYWEFKNSHKSIDEIKDKAMRDWIVNYEEVANFLDRKHAMEREIGETGLEIASYFIPIPPVGELKIAGKLGGMALKLLKLRRGVEAVEVIAKGTNLVYKGVDAAGVVRYIGITSREAAERWAEHLEATGTGRELLNYSVVDGAQGLTRREARIWEQKLINQYGMQKNGGQLLNKINSIAERKWEQYGITK